MNDEIDRPLTEAEQDVVADELRSLGYTVTRPAQRGEGEIWDRCAKCGRQYAFPYLCREHMLCGACHPLHRPATASPDWLRERDDGDGLTMLGRGLDDV